MATRDDLPKTQRFPFRDPLIAVACICVTGLIVSFFPYFDSEERMGLPLLFSLRGEVPSPTDALIVDIDDISEARGLPATMDVRGFECTVDTGNNVRPFAGPMPRCLYAKLIDIISAGNPSAITVDISFEKDGDPIEDAVLADVIRDAENVILLRRIKSQIDPRTQSLIQRLEPINPLIGDAAFAWAPFTLPKRDLVFQFWTRLEAFGGLATLPAMALLTAHKEALSPAAADIPMEELVRELLRADQFHTADVQAVLDTLDDDARTDIALLRNRESYYLNFFGYPGSIAIADAFQLLKEEQQPDFTGKTVFIGQVHLDTYQQADSFPTVFSQSNGIDLAGVEIAATAFLNLYHQQTLEQLSPLATTVLIFVFGSLFAFLILGLRPHVGIPILLTVVLLASILALAMFTEKQLWFPTSTLYAMAVMTLFVGAYLQLDRLLVWIKWWVPHQLQSMVWFQRDASAKPVDITGLIVKCDVENYTAASEMSEGMDLLIGVDAYLSEAGQVVRRSGGQFIAPGDDSFIAFWELPLTEEKIWRPVVESILQLSQLALQVHGENGQTFRRNRIGMAYGKFSVGGMGAMGDRALNAQGVVVNTAARLETLNKDLRTRILAPATLSNMLSSAKLQNKGTHHLRGLSEPVEVVEIMPHT